MKAMLKSYRGPIILAALMALLICGGVLIVRVLTSGVFDPDPIVDVGYNPGTNGVLRVVTDKSYWPYSFIDENGNLSGHEIEVVGLIAKELGMELDLKAMTWNECIDAAEARKTDLVLTCADSTMGRETYYLAMSTPVECDSFTIFGRPDEKTQVRDLSALKNRRLGLMREGNINTTMYSAGFQSNCREYDSYREVFEAIAKGEIDFTVARYTPGLGWIRRHNIKNVKPLAKVGPSYFCIGVDNSRPDLLRSVNNAIAILRVRGDADRLNRKWLTTYVEPRSILEVLREHPLLLSLFVAMSIILVSVLLSLSWALFHSWKERRLREVNDLRFEQILLGLAEDFICINYVICNNNKMFDETIKYRTSEELIKTIPGWEKERYFTNRLNMIADITVEDDRERFLTETRRERICEVLEKNPAHFVDFRLKLNGVERYCQLKFARVHNFEKGKITGFVAGLHDVDATTREEIRLREQLAYQGRRLEIANRAKTDFLFNMSHDIRTPMNAILGFTELAIKHIDEQARVKEYLEKVANSGEHLLRLINEVLDMSRIESGKLASEESQVCVIANAKSVCEMNRTLAAAKDIELIFDAEAAEESVVDVDLLHLNQILINILSNAIKYTHEGGHVRFKVSGGKGHYLFSIADSGIGMDEQFLQHIFEPFSRERSATVSRVEGTGLGMAIVKRLIDFMGGHINVYSKVGVGTTVVLDMAFKLTENATCNCDTYGEKIKIEAGEQSIHRILIVEDNEINSEIASALLTEAGYEIDIAENGSVAVEKIKQTNAPDATAPYDLVLMDIQMPVMNGYEATKAIRAWEKTLDERAVAHKKLPIIAMTANAFAEDRKAAFEAGMNEHVAKPIKMKELLATIIKVGG